MGLKTLISKGADDGVELPDEVKDYIAKLEDANGKFAANETVLLSTIAKLEEGDEGDGDEGDEDDLDLEEVLKGDDVPQAIKDLISKQATDLAAANKTATEATTIAKGERDARIEREMITKAADELPLIGDTRENVGKLLKAASEKLSADEFGQLVTILKAANEQLKLGPIGKEVGSSQSGDATSDPIKAAVAAIQKDHPEMGDAEAIAKAVEDNPALYVSYRNQTKEG